MIEVVDHPKNPKLAEIASDLRRFHRLRDTDSRAEFAQAEQMFRFSEGWLETLANEVRQESGGENYVRLLIGNRAIRGFRFTKISYDFISIRASRELPAATSLGLHEFHQDTNNNMYHPEPLLYAGNIILLHSRQIAETLSQGGSLDIVTGQPDRADSSASE